MLIMQWQAVHLNTKMKKRKISGSHLKHQCLSQTAYCAHISFWTKIYALTSSHLFKFKKNFASVQKGKDYQGLLVCLGKKFMLGKLSP